MKFKNFFKKLDNAKVFLAAVTFTLCLLTFDLSWCAEFPYGHRAYSEAPQETLVLAGTYRDSGRKERLRKETHQAFQRMQKAAEKDGVRLIVISGFRTKARQKPLWERAMKRHGSKKKAAFWVAPPGYSEHHTGFALDVGDLDRPDTDVETDFEVTKAFQWLTRHAEHFDFELSFPKGSPHIHYESWHWRYVGTEEAKKIFR